MAIHATHLKTLEAVIATVLNIVQNRTRADLHVRRDYTGEFRVRIHLERVVSQKCPGFASSKEKKEER
jgi:hypothetical protein